MKCKTCENEQEFGAYCLNCGTPFDTPEAKILQEKYKPTQRQRMKVRWRGWNARNKIKHIFADWVLTLRALNFIGSNFMLKILKLIIIGLTSPIWIWWYIWKAIYVELFKITKSYKSYKNIPKRWQVIRDGFYSFLLTISLLSLLISIFMGQIDFKLFGVPLFGYFGLIPVFYFIHLMIKLYESYEKIPKRWKDIRDGYYVFIFIILILSPLILIFRDQIDFNLFGVPLYVYLGLIPVFYIIHIMTELMLIGLYIRVKKARNHIGQVKVQLATKDAGKKGEIGKD